ncbi:hypothetical protein AGR56_09490 [Clostridium sp. DMHC 10]|uniref:hypothetical protein n=1 Tax=Clostridium sp. DMHC 10 TaxID=747377 RepID=UPI00069E4FDC|nr:MULTISPECIES: hypothetical protein [Clostridium]KOF56862.1 hypothetical protein AGR56_09490 [Clostridium sp. DMHC 10]
MLRHRSLLDIMTKLQESQARINRAVAKSATNCGCIEIQAKKVHLPKDFNIEDIEILNKNSKSSIKGNLCENCRDIIEGEIGNNLFYLAALCNSLDINLYDIMLKEYNKIDTLGKYTFR